MPDAFENPSKHDPALGRDHAAGVPQQTVSPSERALAPEADEPMQSATAITDDGTYVGQVGGYVGGESPSANGEHAAVEPANVRGDGVYGFPAGPGVGVPGGEHQPVAQKPDVVPNPYPER